MPCLRQILGRAALLCSWLLPITAAAADLRHGGPVTTIIPWQFDDGTPGYLSGGFDGRVIAWTTDLEAKALLAHHPMPLEKLSTRQACADCQAQIVVSPAVDGAWNFAKAFGRNGTITIDRQGVGRLGRVSESELPGRFPTPIDIDLSGDILLTIERNRPARRIDLATQAIAELPAGGIAVASGRLLDGRRALLGSVDGYLSLVSLESLEILAREEAHPAPILSIAAAADGGLALTAGANGTITAWRIDSDTLVVDRVVGQFGFPVLGMLLDETRERVVIGHKDGHLAELPLAGGMALNAPPKPATLFARAAPEQEEEPGARLFRACAACHSFARDGGNKAGPTFAGLIGRRAGTVPGYPYSRALLDSTLIWSEKTLSELFEQGPEHYLPGTTMPLQRLANDRDRALLIEYIVARDTENLRSMQP